MKYNKVFSLFLALFFAAPIHGASVGIDRLFQPAAMLKCVSFEIRGTCVKWVGPIPVPGIEIVHWRPELIVETVKMPGDSLLPVIGEAVGGMSRNALRAITGAVVTSGSSTMPRSNYQFSEAHVYDYPFKNWLTAFLPLWCEGDIADFGSAGFIKYLSETDALEWRFGVLETAAHPEIALNVSCLMPVRNPLCMGYWGPIYPRTGGLVHQSEVVGSAANAFRAVSNTSLFGRNNHRVRITPIWWRPSTDDKLQMFYPKVTGCISIGENPVAWEGGKTSPSGKYLWLYWRQVSCCLIFESDDE